MNYFNFYFRKYLIKVLLKPRMKIIFLILLMLIFLNQNIKIYYFFENKKNKVYCKNYGLLVYDYHYSLVNPFNLLLTEEILGTIYNL